MGMVEVYIYMLCYIYVIYVMYTDLYSRPTGCHQILEFNLAHPIHIKNNCL